MSFSIRLFFIKFISVLLFCSCLSTNLAFAAEDHTPVPYSADEFSNAAKDANRMIIITLGSIPFSLLLTSCCFDTYRYFTHDMNRAYAPLFFKEGAGVPYTEDEQKTLFFTAVGVSLGAALVDLGIQHFSRQKAKAEELSNKKGIIELLPQDTPLNEEDSLSNETQPTPSTEILQEKSSHSDIKIKELENLKVDEALLSSVLKTTGGVLLTPRTL